MRAFLPLTTNSTSTGDPTIGGLLTLPTLYGVFIIFGIVMVIFVVILIFSKTKESFGEWLKEKITIEY